MYIIVTEKYIALTIVLNTIIIAVYKSIAINYYFWGSYLLFIYLFLNFVFGSLWNMLFHTSTALA